MTKFLQELDIIDAKMSMLSLQEKLAALKAQRKLIERDVLDAEKDIEQARKQYHKLLLIRGVN